MLDVLNSKHPPLNPPKFSLSFLEEIRSTAEQYLYAKNGTQQVTILKTSFCGKYHYVKLEDKKITNTFWERVCRLSYYTPLPLIARLIVYLIKKSDLVAFYENPARSTSLFTEYVANKKLSEAKGVYKLKKEVLQEKDSKGRTAFIAACEEGHKESIRCLYKLTKGSVLNDLDQQGRTAFVAAYNEGRIGVAICLYRLSEGKVLDKLSDTKKTAFTLLYKEAQKTLISETTPFIQACEVGDIKKIKQLYQETKGAVLEDLDDYGNTPFIVAAGKGHLEAVKCLCELSEDAVLKDRNNLNRTAFMVACKEGHLEVVKYLHKKNERAWEDRDDYENTSFMIACENGKENVVRYLYKYIGDLLKTKHSIYTGSFYHVDEYTLQRKNKLGETAATLACKNGQIKILKCLYELSNGRVFDVKDSKGRKMFVAACEENQIDVIKALHGMLIYKTDRDKLLGTKDSKGRTPFQAACEDSRIEVIKCLYELPEYDFERKELLTKTNFVGTGFATLSQTPFEVACSKSRINVIRCLYEISKGDVLNKFYFSDRSPFQSACEEGRIDTIECLFELSKGKVLKESYGFGDTPFIVACKKWDMKVAECLYRLSKGSVLHEKDYYGNSGFMNACTKDRLDIVDFLYNATSGAILKDNPHWKAKSGPKVIRYLQGKLGHEEQPRTSSRSADANKRWGDYQPGSYAFNKEPPKENKATTDAFKFILGDKVPTSQKFVEKAYKKLALKWHPDRNPDNKEEADAKFKELGKAYDLIKDSKTWEKLPLE